MLQDIIDRSLFNASSAIIAMTNSMRGNNNTNQFQRLQSQFNANNSNNIFQNGFSPNNSNYLMQNTNGCSGKKISRFSSSNNNSPNINENNNRFDATDEQQQRRSNNTEDVENKGGAGVTVLAKKFVQSFFYCYFVNIN